MLRNSLKFTTAVLDQEIRNRFGLDESKVVMNDVVDESGSIPQMNQNKLVLSLINIERETLRPFNIRSKKLADGNFSNQAPIERYNLDIMVSSHFDDYEETLKFLNAAILFFQSNPSMTSTTYSNMPTGITKIDFEMETITYHQMFSLWSAMGAKYRPSVIYKMRLLTLDPNEVTGFESAVKNTTNQINP